MIFWWYKLLNFLGQLLFTINVQTFSELTFDIIQVDNQDWNRSSVDMVVQNNATSQKEEPCGDVETGTCQAWIQSSHIFPYDASTANM